MLISAVLKNIIHDYTLSLDQAGIKILALESHLASIARVAAVEPDKAILITKSNPHETTVFVLKDGVIYFSRTIPAVFVTEEAFLLKEIDHIKTSFEAEKKIPVTKLDLAEVLIKNEYAQQPELKKLNTKQQSAWLASVGAALRGEILKGNDDHISLLSIGTAEAYLYQKMATFITLIRNMTVGISLFFLCAFTAIYVFIFSLPQITQSAHLNISPSIVSKDMVEIENLIKNTNEISRVSAEILSITPKWSMLLDDINAHIINGVLITNFSAPSVADTMSLVGTAKDRNTLNELKKSLQKSIYVTEVELPITHLEQKGDIPFSISFRLKDPLMLYNQ